MATTLEQSRRYELLGGPMDGDHRTSKEFDLYFSAYEPGHTHHYRRGAGDFEWQGLVELKPEMRMFTLRPGEKS